MGGSSPADLSADYQAMYDVSGRFYALADSVDVPVGDGWGVDGACGSPVATNAHLGLVDRLSAASSILFDECRNVSNGIAAAAHAYREMDSTANQEFVIPQASGGSSSSGGKGGK